MSWYAKFLDTAQVYYPTLLCSGCVIRPEERHAVVKRALSFLDETSADEVLRMAWGPLPRDLLFGGLYCNACRRAVLL